MADKAGTDNKKQQQPPTRQPADRQQPGPCAVGQDAGSQIATALDAPDPLAQARRLADARIALVQRQALAGLIGHNQGNRHLSAILAQRPAEAAGSAPSIQRQVLPDIVGRRLATIQVTNERRTTAEGQVTVEDELVPEGNRPGQFDGYGRRIQAQSRAAAEANLSAVVEDRQGKFHALRTGWPGRTPDLQVNIIMAEHDFRRVWWVNLPGNRGTLPESGPRSWNERVSRALAWHSDLNLGRMPANFAANCRHTPSHATTGATLADVRRCLEAEFAELLAIALDVERSEIHVIPQGQQADPDALVNFNIDLDDRGRGGIGHLPRDSSSPVRRPSVTVGPAAFESETRLSVISTTIHESEHVREALDATQLLEQWRSSRTSLDFPAWLRRQMRRRRNPITQVQHDLALELWNAGNRSAEILAYIEGFIRTYRRRPITPTRYRFDSLDTVARFWSSSSSTAVRNEGIQRLVAFYRTLDPAHRSDLSAHATRMADSAIETHRPFWERFSREIR